MKSASTAMTDSWICLLTTVELKVEEATNTVTEISGKNVSVIWMSQRPLHFVSVHRRRTTSLSPYPPKWSLYNHQKGAESRQTPLSSRSFRLLLCQNSYFAFESDDFNESTCHAAFAIDTDVVSSQWYARLSECVCFTAFFKKTLIMHDALLDLCLSLEALLLVLC